jgi:hypothetical protein
LEGFKAWSQTKRKTQLGGIEYNGRSSKSKAKKSFPFSKTAIKYTILFMRRRSS